MENIKIENKNQSDITKELKNDFKNYERRNKGYHEELYDLGTKHLETYKNKIENAKQKLENNSIIDEKLKNRFDAAEKAIKEKTKELNSRDYLFHHNELLNALGAIIDNYENDAIDIINDLISTINNEQEIQGEKSKIDNINRAKEYIKINADGTYTLTQHTNKPKIHEVLKSVIKEGELWKIDYSECKNNSIKTKMINVISESKYENTQQSSSCYLRYDQNQKTYILSDGSGQTIPQRALIREGVKLTPPSKIKGDTKATIEQNKETQIDKINNIQLSNEEQKALFESMPKKMREKLSQQDVNNFFEVTEKSMNERIIEAKKEGYSLNTNKPISKYEGKGFLMKLNLINENAETSKPLIENKFDKDVRDAFSKGKLKKYLTSRIRQKRNNFDYLTKRGTVLDQNTDREGNSENLLDSEKKAFLSKGLSMLGQWAEAVSEKIGNTHLKDDDREFVAIINFIKDAENDINTQSITNNDLATIESKLTQMLSRFFKNNFIRSSLQINKNDIEGYVKDILSSGDKEKQIIAMRKMGASRTRFDNSQTAFLRDDIFEEFGRKEKRDENGEIMKDEEGNIIYEEGVVDLEDDNFEKYFEKINDLYQLDPQRDIGEDGEVKEPKKTNIDNLYKAARENTGKHGVRNFKKRLVNEGLLPKRRGHGGQIDDKIRALKTQLEQQEKNADKFKITGSDIRERTKQQLAEMQATLTSSQIQAAEQGDNGMNDQGIATLNALNFMLQQDDSFFNKLAEDETKNTYKSIKYCGVDSLVRGNLAPYLVRRGGGINSNNEIAKIYNDSVGAGGWFDFSDEGAERIGPLLKEIVVEVVVTAVSILLSRNGAGEAIYAAFRTAKLAAQTMKGFKKFREFMKIFTKNIIKNSLSIGAGKLKVGSIKMGKHAIGGAKTAAEIIKTTETLSKWGKFAIKGTSLIIEGTHFHINSTIIHNIINGEDFWEGLNPLGYTEGPDGEKISNLKSYAQSIAFLGVLKGTGKIMGKLTGKSLQNLTGKEIQNITKGRYGPAMANKIFSTSLSLGSEMGSMMGTDQILSLVFDQSLKPVTGEELISMFGMIVGLRLNGKFQIKIKEYTGQKTTIRMTQEGTCNVFDVRMDGEGNVLKVEGKDKNGKKIQNPQEVLGIKQGDLGQNLRETHADKEVGTIKGGIKELNNLHEGDIITVRHGENDVKFKKNSDGNREVTDASNIKNERFEVGETYIAKENSDGSGYHLETKSGGGPKITLDGRVGVKLGGRESNLHAKSIEQIYEDFDNQIMSQEGITIDGVTYKLEWRPYVGQNKTHKGRVIYTETGPDGKIKNKVEANSDTFSLPENSNGNRIRERYSSARGKYMNKKLNNTPESVRQESDGELNKDIDSKTKKTTEGNDGKDYKINNNESNKTIENFESSEAVIKKIQELNPGIEIKKGLNGEIYCSIDANKLTLPEGFYYNKKNGITNKHNQQGMVYFSIHVEPIDSYIEIPMINVEEGSYEYENGSKFNGEVDKTFHPKEGKLILHNGTIQEGKFNNGQLESGIEISNNGLTKKVKFIGKTDIDFIKNHINLLGEQLQNGESMEIETANGLKITIKNLEGTLVEYGGVSNGLHLANPIEGKLGEYFIKKAEREFILTKISEIKKLETEAKNNKNKELEKQYHNQLIELYIEKMKDIDIAPDNQTKRKEFFDHMTSDEIEAYAHIHQKYIFEKYSEKYHQVANVDDFREFIGGDVGISSDKTHGAASFLGDTYFDYILETNRGTGNNTIKFLAGGPGSGKSSVSAFSESNNNIFSGVLDGTMKTYENAERNIEKSLAMGYNVRVEFVYRDITESFINGVLKRTISQNQKNGNFTGRTVPLGVFEGGHNGARNTALKLYEKYGPNIVKFFGGGDVDLEIGNGILKKAEGNPGKGPGFVYEYNIDYIKNKIGNDKLDIEKCRLAVEEAFMRGEISSSQKDDLLKYQKK